MYEPRYQGLCILGRSQSRMNLIVQAAAEYGIPLKDESVDLVIVDPPFNLGKKYGSGLNDHWNEQKDYVAWAQKWIAECARVLKSTGSIYLFNRPENNAYLLPIVETYFVFRRWITWGFPVNMGHSKTNYTRAQYSILFATKSDTYTFNRDAILMPYRNPTDKRIQKLVAEGSGGRARYDWITDIDIVKNVSSEKQSDFINQIPEALLSVFIGASSNEGDTVMDCCSGSFSTSATALKLGRSAVGIDIAIQNCLIGKRRTHV